MIKNLVFLVLALAVAPSALAQFGDRSSMLIERLSAPSMEGRTLAAMDVYGAGIDSPELYAKLAELIEEILVVLPDSGERATELAWHTKALGTSGDLQFLPLIERVESARRGRLAHHARDAKKVLVQAAENGRPYLDYTKVPLITEAQATQCQLVKQENCQTSRSAEKCVAHHQNNAVLHGGNAIMILHATSRTIGLGPFGGDSSMVANYYRCQG